MALEIRIITGSNAPIYRQIADQIRKAVATGQLTTGDQLPSVRALAEMLVINPNTVARAYNDLVNEGVLQSQPGRGLFVARRQQKFSEQDRRQRLESALEVFLNEVLFLDFGPEEILDQLKTKLAELTEADETPQTDSGRPAPGDIAPRGLAPEGDDDHV